MATAVNLDDYQQILTEYLYLFSKYIVATDFTDKLISDGVLNLEDKEHILNPFTNQSRREKAAKLIEVLHTRGPVGFTKFLEILEYQYPHVFREVTKQEPRKPPPGFQRNRTSDQLQMINDLPRLAQHIKDQHQQNTTLQEELTVLQGLMEFSKEENAALEKDLDQLKYVKQTNDDLRIKIINLENENKELQINMNKEMQRSFKYIEERDEYQQKCEELQIKYDQQYKKCKELEKGNAGNNQNRAPSPRPAPVPQDDADVRERRNVHTVAQLSILRDELEEWKSQADDLSHRLQVAEDNIRMLELRLKDKTKELHIQTKENRNLEDQLKESKLKSEAYYKLIHDKDDEINLLNRQKMNEQQRVAKLTMEKTEIFQEKHNMGVKLEQLKQELDKIKVRFSGSSQDLSQESCSDDDRHARSFEDGDVPDNIQVVAHPYFDRHKPRRQCRKRSVPGRLIGKGQHEPSVQGAGSSSGTNHNNLSMTADVDSSEMFKSRTMPVGSETPEMFFQREIALFRYSKKETRHPPLQAQASSQSMTTQPGSIHGRPQPLPRDKDSVHRKRELYSMCTRGDQSDQASDSTVFVARQSGQKPYSGRPLDQSVNEDRESETNSDSSGSRSSGGFSLINDLSPYDLRGELIPKPCAQVTRKGAPDSLSLRTVSVKFPVVNDRMTELKGAIEIVGGNHTGIFISKVLHKGVDLLEGEEIKEIMYTPNERAQPVEATLQGCTLEDAYRLLSDEYIRPRKEREVKLKVRKCRLEYDSACKWMGENKGTGDFLFIRCNAHMEKRPSEDSVTPRAGDIFQVKNSRYNRRQWLGYRVNESTGSIDKTEIKIPNPVEAGMRRLPSLNRSVSDDSSTGSHSSRRQAIKIRGVTYERVLPMKASVQLPVYVIGHSRVVNGLLDLVARQLSTNFHVKSSDAGGSRDGSELSRNDIHMVKKCSIDKIATVKPHQRILVFVNVTDEMDPELCSQVFGEAFGYQVSQDVITTSRIFRQKLAEASYKFEELSLPDIRTRDKLLETFQRCVNFSQSRTLWLSSLELDPEIANLYPRYLGHSCDLNTIMAEVQKAQSFDHS